MGSEMCIRDRRDGDGKRRISGGKGSKVGTPQGGVISPLLANLHMNRFLKYWRSRRCEEAFRAKLVNYADDFVILSRGHAQEALAWTRQVMTRLGLTLNEAKTSVKDARTESFDFLGYTFGVRYRHKDGRAYQAAYPSRKSLKRIKAGIGDLLVPGNMAPWPQVRDKLNNLLTGWAAYFAHGSCAPAHRAVNYHVSERVRGFLARRHKEEGRGTIRFSWNEIFGECGVRQLKLRPPNVTAVSRP